MGFPRRSPRPVPRDPAGFAPALRGGDGEEDGAPSRVSAGPKGDLCRAHSSETELTNTSDTNRCQRGCQATLRATQRPGSSSAEPALCSGLERICPTEASVNSLQGAATL